MDMASIVSKESPPAWPSMTPATYHGLSGAMAVLRHCSSTATWHLAEDHWMCQLLAPGMLVRHVADTSWTFCAGIVG
eukprot:4975568-Lingulodinium_polyedra.AAC.1